MSSDADGPDGSDRDGETEEWRFSLDEFDEVVDTEEAAELPVEPGSPRLENVLFFALGALVAVGVFALLLAG